MSIVETPTKATAAALSVIDLNTPTLKLGDTTLLAKLKAAPIKSQVVAPVKSKAVTAEVPVKSLTVQTQKAEVEEYRKRFVGDLNCTEADEPLLKETTSRFVLFPINYREVSA